MEITGRGPTCQTEMYRNAKMLLCRHTEFIVRERGAK